MSETPKVRPEYVGMTLADHLAEQRKDPQYRLAEQLYDADKQLRHLMLAMRKMADITQKELAKFLGTKQSAIARLESEQSTRSPRIQTIAAVADACGFDMELVFRPREPKEGDDRHFNIRVTDFKSRESS